MRESIDLRSFFAYNRYMENTTHKKRTALLALRITLSLACALVLAFIFSNSLKTGNESSAQSSVVVAFVQDVAKAIAPWSGIAEATGEDYARLHNTIRTLAHFSEFALFGALACWCTLSYTRKKKAQIFPFCGVCLAPLIDESIQLFTAGRGAEWLDVFVDIAGGISGMGFALACFTLGAYVYYKKKRKNNVAGPYGNRSHQIQ